MKQYYVYIMASEARTLYVGVTNNLQRRVQEHKMGETPGFTQKYGLTRLVYYEETPDVLAAKGKVALIEAGNPGWRDLSHDWVA